MEILDKIKDFIENLELKDFYKYLAATLGVILFIVVFLIFNFYRKIHSLNDQISLINEQRERAQRILTQAERVKRQRITVDAILSKEPDFKIGNYFDKVVTKLQLNEKKTSIDYSHVENVEDYKENILKAKLTDINMKQLCDLLNEIEANERIYTKELEIITGKNSKTIDVNLAIATLEPKEKQKV